MSRSKYGLGRLAWVPLCCLMCTAVAQADGVDFNSVRAAYQPSDWVIADHNGVPLETVRHDTKVRRLPWLSLDDVSPALQTTMITAEDRRFWEHGGVDWAAVAKAALARLPGGDHTVRGASTVTMQLAGLLDPALQAAPGTRRNLGQKWDQALAARDIEKTWTKRQIFEAYLNLLPMRGETVGLRAASQLWFGKSPDGLDWTEAALLSALVRQPQAKADKVAERACAIVAAIDDSAFSASTRPDCDSIRAKALLALGDRPAYAVIPGVDLAPHAARLALTAWGTHAAPRAAVAGGMPVLRTTLDQHIQQIAVESLRAHLREIRGQNAEDGAIVVLDNATGNVVAWVGSSGSDSNAREVDGVLAERQAGSTLKPFLYGVAIEQHRITAASLLHDSPIALTAANGAYVPQNYDRQFKGWVTARTALASSLNIPAVRTLLLTGVDAFYNRLKALGFQTLDQTADHYGFGLALGDADVRLIDLTNAYRTYANGGQWSPVAPVVFSDHPTPVPWRRVYSPEVSYIIGDILSDRGARAPTFGLENALSTRVWAAVKTGTSKDMRDNWCVGFTSHYTVGVWVGNFNGTPMWDVSGVHGAAPVWRDLIHALHESIPDPVPKPPASLVPSTVHFVGIAEAKRREWFLRGTETHEIARADLEPSEARPRITYPADGLVIAVDPDLPESVERVVLQADRPLNELHWRLERTSGSPCQQTLATDAPWPPQPGNWILRLLDENDSDSADPVHFIVRGSARHELKCEQAAASHVEREVQPEQAVAGS